MAANKKYKDSIFTLLFNNPTLLIELANALLGTSYGAETEIIINTLKDVLFFGRKNDISFLLGDRPIVLIEHQSTINRNMPLRFLIYIARLYELLVDGLKIFKPALVLLPQPIFIVLYNGLEPCDDITELRLSSAFLLSDGERPNLELIVKVININAGHNAEILSKSPTLAAYSRFVEVTRDFEREAAAHGGTLRHALTKAAKYCINNNILSKFLQEHSTEVRCMSLMNWTIEDEKAYCEAVGIEKERNRILELLEKGLSVPELKAQLVQQAATEQQPAKRSYANFL
jgi:hypothetical protein